MSSSSLDVGSFTPLSSVAAEMRRNKVPRKKQRWRAIYDTAGAILSTFLNILKNCIGVGPFFTFELFVQATKNVLFPVEKQ
jgi:hypothetical protein